MLEGLPERPDAPRFGASEAVRMRRPRMSELEEARQGLAYILGLTNCWNRQRINASEQEWAGRVPLFPQLFLQHSRRIAQDTYVLVAIVPT